MLEIKTAILSTGEVVEATKNAKSQILLRRNMKPSNVTKPSLEYDPSLNEIGSFDIVDSIMDIEKYILNCYCSFPMYSNLKFVKVNENYSGVCKFKVRIYKIINGFISSEDVNYLVFGIRYVNISCFDYDDRIIGCKQNPWVVFLFGCDDIHYYKRFETKEYAFKVLNELPMELEDSYKYLVDHKFLPTQ